MGGVDPKAPTEENEPVRLPPAPSQPMPRVLVAIVAAIVFIATLLAVVGVVAIFSLLKR